MDDTSRRQLLAQAAILAGASLLPSGWARSAPQAKLPADPFTLGVASGEPLPDGMVLWTRLALKPTELGSGMDAAPVKVKWVIAEDDKLSKVVGKGETVAAAEAGHSVHVEVEGLRPDRWYWYRFTAGGYESPVGRTRTAPLRGAAVQSLRVGYGSCQKYETGFYAAHRQMAADHPDLILFLGDYIYEGSTGPGVRKHPAYKAQDLASYRQRYGLYKSDHDLQAAHAAAPWMVIWDDHEVSNDYGDDQDRSNPDPATFLKRRAAGYQAFYENMPLRRRIRPVGPNMQLYRLLAWGNLAEIAFLDGRQNRDHRTCEAVSNEKIIPDCPERQDPKRSLLGMPQEKWLHETLKDSHAKWNVLAQQYLMGELKLEDGRFSNDGWDGYPQTRQRILETWRDAKVSNPLALGGDIHCFFAGDLALEPGKPIASEYVGGSISSLGRDNAALDRRRGFNPHLKFSEGEHRGYGLVEMTPTTCEVTFKAVQSAFEANSPVHDLVKFAIADGKPGLQRA